MSSFANGCILQQKLSHMKRKIPGEQLKSNQKLTMTWQKLKKPSKNNHKSTEHNREKLKTKHHEPNHPKPGMVRGALERWAHPFVHVFTVKCYWTMDVIWKIQKCCREKGICYIKIHYIYNIRVHNSYTMHMFIVYLIIQLWCMFTHFWELESAMVACYSVLVSLPILLILRKTFIQSRGLASYHTSFFVRVMVSLSFSLFPFSILYPPFFSKLRKWQLLFWCAFGW